MPSHVKFTKVCIKCNRYSDIPNVILFIGYEKKLDIQNPKCLNELEVVDILYDWHEEQQIKCEFCNELNKFIYHNIEINGDTARIDNITHYDYLSRMYLIAIAFEEYHSVINHLNLDTKLVENTDIEKFKASAILYIDEISVKVMFTSDFINGVEIFNGRIMSISHNKDKKVSTIFGVTKHPLDDSQVKFKLNLGVEKIEGEKIKNKDNYYIEMEPCHSDIAKIRGILLVNTLSTNGFPTEKTAYYGELY
jgi:hypothetical protein